MTLRTDLKLAATAALTLLFAACGGGSDEPAPPSNRLPVANAVAPSQADEFAVVTLDGSQSSDPDGDTLQYTWEQTAGPDVAITGANAERASFTAPDVFAATPRR